MKIRVRRAGAKAKAQQRFTALRTSKQAAKIASAESGTEYQPAIRQLKGEIGGSKKREGEIGQWYGSLGDLVAQAREQAAATDSATAAQTTARIAAAGAQDTSQLQKLSAQDQAFAKLVGGPTNAPGMAQAAAGNTALAQQRITMAQPQAAAAANFQKYLGQQRISAAERGITAHGAEAQRRAKLASDILSARKLEGQATVKNMQTLREGDRNYTVQKQVAALNNRKAGFEKQKFYQEQTLAQIEAAQAAAQQQRENQFEETKIGQTGKEIRNEKVKIRNEKGKHGLTPNEQQENHREAQSAAAKAQDLYNSYKEGGSAPKTATEWAGLAQLVKHQTGADYVTAKKAVERLRGKLQAQARVAAGDPNGPSLGR